MMILIIGNDPQRVELTDLGDVVYYKQQKFFSDSQCARSADLKRALKSGKLTILQKYGNVDQDFVLSQPSQNSSPRDSSKFDLLLEKLNSMERSLSSSQTQSKPDTAVVGALLERIAKLEQQLSGLSKSGEDASLTEAVRQLAEKMESKTKDTAILDRLESILNKSGSSGSGNASEPTRPEDVYVPTVSIEDGNTHIKLDVRSVESSTSELDASLEALRKMKAGK